MAGALDDLPTPGEPKPGELPGQSPEDLETDRRQRPMEVDPTKYFQTGFLGVGMGKDGMPVMTGDPPVGPEPGLTDDNFICNASSTRDENGVPLRPKCKHYIAILTPAEGVAHGHEELRQIRRFCRQLATASELFELDGDLFACSSREPQDPRSIALLDGFEMKQKQVAEEAAETSGNLDF